MTDGTDRNKGYLMWLILLEFYSDWITKLGPFNVAVWNASSCWIPFSSPLTRSPVGLLEQSSSKPGVSTPLLLVIRTRLLCGDGPRDPVLLPLCYISRLLPNLLAGSVSARRTHPFAVWEHNQYGLITPHLVWYYTLVVK